MSQVIDFLSHRGRGRGNLNAAGVECGPELRSFTQEETEKLAAERERLEAEREAQIEQEAKRGEIMAAAQLAEKLLVADLGKTMAVHECFDVADQYIKEIKERLSVLEEGN